MLGLQLLLHSTSFATSVFHPARATDTANARRLANIREVGRLDRIQAEARDIRARDAASLSVDYIDDARGRVYCQATRTDDAPV